MPPKKIEKEEIDISTLPPWQSILVTFAFLQKKGRAEKIIDLLLNKPKSFQKNISRIDIINFAKEKGLYVDPNNLTEKQKKDAKIMAELPLELTSNILAKSLYMMIYDMNINSRKV